MDGSRSPSKDKDTDDVESVDVNAKRQAIIEERFDSALHDGKKFDESVLKEVRFYYERRK